MVVRSEARLAGELARENARLRAELERREREAAENERQLERYAADLRETFKQERFRSLELKRSYMATVRALSNAVEARDVDTGKHAGRVAAYGIQIARVLELPLDRPGLEFGFLLHDIGKVAIPDAILHKPGSLTADERALMAQHPVIGFEILAGIEFLGVDAAAIVRSHHERWDGSGYPDGLAGDRIPLAARAFAVADVFDALTSDRPYRPAWTIPRARAKIVSESGAQFDPAVVEAFSAIDNAVFERIREQIS
jgi:HD-GYP domain-containing protein (c-di-GMP phosphodiesterase class II)